MARRARLRDLGTRVRARWPLAAGVAVLVMIPLVRVVGLVRSSSKLQYGDYWPMLDRMLNDDGSWSLGGILAPRNEHPIAIPKAAYAANAELFGGSNHALGALVIAIALAQVALVCWMALDTQRYSRWQVAALTVSASFLLLAPHGAWNFVKAMSGTAWLTANLFALAALAAQRSRRRYLTPIFALMATASYATGLATWPALVLLALLEGRRALREWWTVFVAGSAALGGYLAWYLSKPSSPFERPALVEQGKHLLELVGSVLAGGSWGIALGAVAVVGTVGCSIALARHQGARTWIGLSSYGLAACVLVTLGRFTPFTTFSASRYTSLSALVWLGLVAQTLALLPKRWWVVVVPVPLIVAVSFGGASEIEDERRAVPGQELRAIALRLGVADQAPGPFAEPFPEITDRLERIGHYPFNDAFTDDCNDLGEAVPTRARPGEQVIGRVAAKERLQGYPGTESFTGRIQTHQFDVDCVVVLDGGDTVVGVGGVWPAPLGEGSAFVTLTPEGSGDAVFVRLAGRDEYVPLRTSPEL